MIILSALAIVAVLPQKPKIDVHWSETGATKAFSMVGPKEIVFAAESPLPIKGLPPTSAPRRYGVLKIGLAKPVPYTVVIEGLDKVWVDANANLDFSDDKPITWKATEVGKDAGKFRIYASEVTLDLQYGNVRRRGSVRFGYQAPVDPANKKIPESGYFFADYGYIGKITLAGKTYNCTLADTGLNGDFRGKPEGFSGSRLFVDINANGYTDDRGEAFDVRKPFNIAGTTYELYVDVAGKAQVGLSKEMVAEIPLPPNLSVGQKMPPFVIKSSEGKDLAFPSSFKGKLVLIDIWATWCTPCIGELPNLAKAHQQYKDRGLEIVSISIDDPGLDAKVKEVEDKYGMVWTHAYEGKGMKAEPADLFAVRAIPFVLLIDGTTGEILAKSLELRGETLFTTIEKALARRG